ncbi:MAG: hypothetical protein ABMA26_19150 [Limisphaerales bacterium]
MIQALRKQVVRGGALAALLVLSGCSTFSRDWKAAAAKPMPANSVEGRWEGRWHSDHNGHNGGLRALVMKLDSGQYEARFHATYAVVLSFGSTVNLDVRPAGGLHQFSGSADLGKAAGGLYHYEGKASATNFFSTYKCPSDHGTFQMTRPTR